MSEKMRQAKSKKEKLVLAATVVGSLLMPHSEARSFEIQAGSTFDEGMKQIREGTRHETFETQGFLIAEPDEQGNVRYTWCKQKRLGTAGGEMDMAPERLSSEVLKGDIAETGQPFVVYNIHTHHTYLPVENIAQEKRVYSVPPSAGDVLSMQEKSFRVYTYGSRTFTVKYVVSDAAGLWSFDQMSQDEPIRGPLVLGTVLEGNADDKSPLHAWIEANASKTDKSGGEIETELRSQISSDAYASLAATYAQVGVRLKYTLWPDVAQGDFPAAQQSQ